MTTADAPGDQPTEQAVLDVDLDAQCSLAHADAHVRIVLDRHTRELGLANVAAIKRALADSAARRAASAHGGHGRHGQPSGRAA
ncbi:MAG: hypothetical protein ACKOYG_04380 [Ilumatobacteraceae bacterium]